MSNGEIDPDLLMPEETEDTEETFADLSQWMETAEDPRHVTKCNDQPHAHKHDSGQSGIRTFVVELDEPVDRDEFNEFMQELALEFGENLLRMKGILNVADKAEQPAVVHGVQHVFFPIRWLDRWPGEDRTSKLVFITQGLGADAVQARFDSRSAAAPSADSLSTR